MSYNVCSKCEAEVENTIHGLVRDIICGQCFEKVTSENAELQQRITELGKQVVVWHKYPDEKPEKPDGFDGMWLNILTIDECGCTWIGTCRFIGAQLDVLAPQTTKYWAYLPAAPKEESDDKS